MNWLKYASLKRRVSQPNTLMMKCSNDFICNCYLGKPDLVISEDEEYKRFDPARFPKLPTAFQVVGTRLFD